jgi:hypothetical protein
MNKYHYTAKENDSIVIYPRDFEITSLEFGNLNLIAEAAADDFDSWFSNVKFPITIFLYEHKFSKTILGAFTIEKHIEVSYFAKRMP